MSASEPSRFADLVGTIYDAALQPERWTSVLENVLPFVQARSGILFTPFDPIESAGFSFTANISQDFLQMYASRYQQHDVWAIAARKADVARSGNVVAGDDLVPRSRLIASRFYREFLRKEGTSRNCIAWIFTGDEQPAILNTVLTVARGIRSRPFSVRSMERLRLLVPHLSRSLGVMFRLRDADLKVAATRAALDRLAAGIVLIGERRQIVFVNRAAARLLGERDGVELAGGRGSEERLAASTHSKTAEIDAAIGQALAPASADIPHFSVGVRVPRSAGRAPVVLNISALPEDNAFGGPADRARVIVFITDAGASPPINAELVKRFHSLTDAEMRLVEQVCAGGSLKEVAARLGVSEATAHTQLQSVFGKTETSRQAELVKLVLSLSSPLR